MREKKTKTNKEAITPPLCTSFVPTILKIIQDTQKLKNRDENLEKDAANGIHYSLKSTQETIVIEFTLLGNHQT
jgi:hypothetical protein